MSIVTSSLTYFPNPKTSKPLFNGYIYVGEPDLDPKIPANQKQVSLKLKDGSTIQVGQPLRTSPGGTVSYDGNYAIMLVDGDFSIRGENNRQSQVFYIPNNENLFNAGSIGITINGLARTSVESYLENKEVPNAAEMRALPTLQVADGDLFWDVNFPDPFVVKTGAVTDSGRIRVLDDDPNRYLESTAVHANPKLFGAVEDGVTDDSAAIENMLNSGIKKIVIVNDCYMASRKVITNQDNLEISGGGKLVTDVMEGCLEFSGCDNLIIDGLRVEGGETRAVWQAYLPAERQQLISLITLTGCANPSVRNVLSSQHRSAFKFDICTETRIDHCEHEGCYGEISLGVVTDPNYGYSYFFRGGSDHMLTGLMSNESSGTVLIQLTASNVQSVGGYAKNCHDNGWYGSSCRDSKVSQFHIEDGLQTGVKTRGYNNIIFSNTAKNLDVSYAYDMTGIPLDSVVDAQGAVGYGGGIFNNTAEDCDSLASLRFTSETGPLLYLRDVKCSGNTGINLSGVANHPIEVYGVVNIECKDNTINTFAAPFAILAQGPSSGSKGVNYDITGNHASNGSALLRTSVIEESKVDNNGYTSMSDVRVIDTVTCDNVTLTNNKGDDVAKRIDCRSSTDMKVFFNDMFIEADAGEIDAESNNYQPTVDTGTVIPNRIGRIVQDSGGVMYISNATSATTDWKAIH